MNRSCQILHFLCQAVLSICSLPVFPIVQAMRKTAGHICEDMPGGGFCSVMQDGDRSPVL